MSSTSTPRPRGSGFTDWLVLGMLNVVNLLAPELVALGDLLAAMPGPVLAEVDAPGAAQPGRARSA